MPNDMMACQTTSMSLCRHDCQLAAKVTCITASLHAVDPACCIYCLPACQPMVYGPPMIIVVANSKGGVGKSTLAVHLAAWLHEQGYNTTLADCDTQHSSSEWAREAVPDMKTVRLSNADEILDKLPQLGQEADYVVADGPGSNTETSRALLLRADMALVPCKASMLEVRALAQATKALRHAQEIRKGQPRALIVLSMVGKNYRLTQDMKDAAMALHFPMAKTSLTLRQIYADAPGQGAVVWRMGARGREATQEVRAFFNEVLPEVNQDKSRRPSKRVTA